MMLPIMGSPESPPEPGPAGLNPPMCLSLRQDAQFPQVCYARIDAPFHRWRVLLAGVEVFHERAVAPDEERKHAEFYRESLPVKFQRVSNRCDLHFGWQHVWLLRVLVVRGRAVVPAPAGLRPAAFPVPVNLQAVSLGLRSHRRIARWVARCPRKRPAHRPRWRRLLDR